MDRLVRRRRDLAMPAAALAGLRKALRTEAGPLTAVHSLHEAGYEAGASLFRTFAESLEEGEPEELDEAVFWKRLSAFLCHRGWGTLEAETDGAAVGILASADWAEAEGTVDEELPSCYFSSGLLAGILSEIAGAPVAVMEVACRGRAEDERCRFAFGSEGALHELYGDLLQGTPLEEALERLERPPEG